MSWFSDAMDDVGSFFGDDGDLSDQVDPSSWFNGDNTPSTNTNNTSNNPNSGGFLNAVGGAARATANGQNAMNNTAYSLIHPVDPQVRGQVNPVNIRPEGPPTNTRGAQTIDGMSVQNYWMTMMKQLASGGAK